MSDAFADRLIDALRAKGNPLCVGLDPFPDKIPALFGDARADVSAVRAFGEAIIDIAAHHAGVLKPQLGLFEAYGPEGYTLARDLTQAARARGLIVILDAKRGDIGTTAEGYAQASLGPAPNFDADAVTVAPYMGKDSIAPFTTLAHARGKGVAVLVRTSNAGAKDLQDLDCHGAPLWRRTAEMIAPDAAALMGESGWSGLMAVAGATYPEEARALRAVLPTSLFLVPGYGAQGASAADAVAGFVRGPRGLEGGVVNASRSVTYPASASSARNLSAWRESVGESMKLAAAELASACA